MATIASDPMTSQAAASVPAKLRAWQAYADAELGFRNHWYLAGFSADFREGEPVAMTLLGEKLLVNRVEDKVYAVRDRCLHRGVSLSRKIECYSRDTVTCWYHGWTYSWKDGKLVAILTCPDSSTIGRVGIKSYPVEERAGLVFIYVGDEEAPDVLRDTPLGFDTPNRHYLGYKRIVESNWRMGAENGFDITHIYIHRNSILIPKVDMIVPLGFNPPRPIEHAVTMVTEDDAEYGGRRGVLDRVGEVSQPVFEGRIGDEVVERGKMGSVRAALDVSIWLPGILRVNPWPVPGTIQYEFYVPIDENRHYYFQIMGREVHSDEERQAFERDFNEVYLENSIHGFNDDDVWAREEMQGFYGEKSGWSREMLFEPDANLLAWRRVASRHNRGVQTRELANG